MIVLLLWTTAFAVSGNHRQDHLAKCAATEGRCGICLFAHAHVIAHDPLPLLVTYVGQLVVQPLLLEFTMPAAFENRLPQGRAPPALFS